MREAGPTIVASVTTTIAAYGWNRNWPEPIVAYLLFFACSLCIASLIARGASTLRSRWRNALAEP